MQREIRICGITGACALVFVAAPVTRAQNFYLNVDAGAALAERVEVREFIVRTPNTELKLDPGARISVAGGYNFNEFIGAQLETGFMANEVRRVSGGGDVDATLSHVPLLADIVLRYDQPDCRWAPFVGAGAGGDVSVVDLDHVRTPGGFVVDGTGSDVVFAWQAFAGARYQFNDRMSLGGVYKFYSADGASWDVERAPGNIESGTARVHSFSIDFNLRF